MKLRMFRESDSAAICGWIKDEKVLYQWSADMIGKFPLKPNLLSEYYASVANGDTFFPVCICDDADRLIGHLIIKYPNSEDRSLVRFGFVIINNELRGQGYGRRTMQSAIEYAKNVLKAERITLGVFADNESAKHCYESVGFAATGAVHVYKLPVGEWECIEMELIL